jgi:hypothetical protein
MVCSATARRSDVIESWRKSIVGDCSGGVCVVGSHRLAFESVACVSIHYPVLSQLHGGIQYVRGTGVIEGMAARVVYCVWAAVAPVGT